MAAPQPNTLMRMRYLASEIGHRLDVVNLATPTFTLIRDRDRTVHVSGVGASLATIKPYLAVVDPTIVNAT